MAKFAALLVVVMCLQGSVGVAQPLNIEQGGGAVETNWGICMSEAVRAQIEEEITSYTKAYGPLSVASKSVAADPYTFHPLAGTEGEDLFLSNYVDLDGTSGILDWDCTSISYNGHQGHDVALRSFGEQSIGVPVFAVQDGVVVTAEDGHFDRNTTWAGQLPNYVVIDHGDGRTCYYLHLKKNSVAVSVGEIVLAGQQIGLAASSGVSTGPHLHFETRVNGQVVEPSAGDCNVGDSLWSDQQAVNREMGVLDFGISTTSLSGFNPPSEFPRNANITLDDSHVYFWLMLLNVPAPRTQRFVIVRPNGSTWTDQTYNYTEAYRWSWWWVGIPNPANGNPLGTWSYRFYIDDVLQFEAPFVIGASGAPDGNDAPEAVTLALEPANPTVNDVLVARVVGDTILDDYDFDIVDYEYVWRVNGEVVRQVTTAARSDALPHHYAGAGNLLEVAVRPGDAYVQGPESTASVLVDGEGLGGDTVWVDFAYAGLEFGTESQPVNMLGEGVILVPSGGTVKIKGDTARPYSGEAVYVDKALLLVADGGTVRLGAEGG